MESILGIPNVVGMNSTYDGFAALNTDGGVIALDDPNAGDVPVYSNNYASAALKKVGRVITWVIYIIFAIYIIVF